MKNLKKMMKKEEGFTLIELIIVIAILAIIAAVAIPNIMGAVDNSRKATDVANAKTIMNAAQTIAARNDGITIGSSTDITKKALVDDATADSFEDKMYKQLNSTIITPKYRASDNPSFILKYDSGSKSFLVETNKGKVAPNPDTYYDQN